jgi:hypothetical protein
MPNWCHNSMKITGPVSEVDRFKAICIRTVWEDHPAQLDFNAIDQMPDFPDEERIPGGGADACLRHGGRPIDEPTFPAWYEWACKHWGTKWNANDFEVTRDEPGHYEFSFDTAWSPPVPIWEKMASMFPDIECSISGMEPLMDYAFEGTIRGGRLELFDRPLIWSIVDPRTGKMFSGTRAEVEAVLDEHEGAVAVSTRVVTDDELPPF